MINNDAPYKALVERCDWPEGGRFTFHDEPGEHDPCYVVMPGGAALALNHHAGEGVDIARAKFIIAACNAALATLSPPQHGGLVEAKSYADFQQRRGRLPDMIEEAIAIYDGFMLDDNYDAYGCLDKIIAKLKSARDFYDNSAALSNGGSDAE